MLRILGPQEFVGESDVVNEQPRTVNAFALTTPTEVLAIDRRAVSELLEANSEFCSVILRALARQLDNANLRQLELSVDSVSGRVSQRLYDLQDRFGVQRGDVIEMRIPITQQELADWSGVSRQAVVKELSALREVGLIRTRGSHITLFDLDAIVARAKGGR